MKQYAISDKLLKEWSKAYAQSEISQVATLALAGTDMSKALYSKPASWRMRQDFSVNLETLPVTDQQHSGRCWLFSATNVLRERIARALNLDQFELSQSYLAFWDKFERANYFLETMIALADRPWDDRTVAFVLATGVHDGGQWDMFANIVRKYGVVPKDVYDETFQSANTRYVNYYLNRALKAGAVKLRALVQKGAEAAEVRAQKEALLGRVYAFLCSCYTEPPRTFDFVYVDKDKNYHREPGYTPQSFRDKYVGDLLDSMVSIINAPTKDKPFGKTYTIRYLGNVVGMPGVKHLNVKMQDFKGAIIAQLQDGKVVWFGSDVGHEGDREKGIWDDSTFPAALVTGLDLTLTKAEALDTGFSAMNHAMVITGVDLVDGKPTKWKIENSWGDKSGEKGYYVCSDTWFDKYVYQAAVEKQYLGDLAAKADKKPVELDPWDPMGTLAE